MPFDKEPILSAKCKKNFQERSLRYAVVRVRIAARCPALGWHPAPVRARRWRKSPPLRDLARSAGERGRRSYGPAVAASGGVRAAAAAHRADCVGEGQGDAGEVDWHDDDHLDGRAERLARSHRVLSWRSRN